MITFTFFLGIFTWTFLEYVLHRFLGHEHKGRNFFKAEHSQHHQKVHYFAPVWKKVSAAAIVSSVLVVLGALFFSVITVMAFVSGLVGMYGVYEITHSRFHKKGPIAKPFILLRKHHFYHHFHNPKVNHGVTTRLWDRVFGTFVPVESVRVPKQVTMSWLMDGDDIDARYVGHFCLGA